MFCNIIIIALGFSFVGVLGNDGWCKASPHAGLPDYARCLPAEQAMARYVVEVAPLVGFGLETKSDVRLILEGSNGRRTKPISIASVSGGTSKRLTADRVDVSNPEVIHAYISSPTAWACRQITVWKDFRYWIFDCGEVLSPLSPEGSFALSGSKVYELAVLTGTDPKGSLHPRARISLVGSVRTSGPKVLEGSFPPGSSRAIRLQAADVGSLQAVVLTNDAAASPWFCKHVTVRSDGSTANFKVGRWIGTPHPSSVYVSLYPSGLELTPQDIDCHTRAADVFEGKPGLANAAKVHCPMNCQASEFAHTQGASLHPAPSSICTAAILDGLMSPSGGDLVVTAVGPVEQYAGAAYNGIESVDFAYSPERQQFSFHMYLVDSVDLIEASIRVINEFGNLSSIGRLEVKNGAVWGSVCNKGDYLTFSPQSALKACQELGFKTGTLLLDGCKDVEGANVCAEKGYPVASAGISCSGNEASLAECGAEKPPAMCLEHNDDVAIKCTNMVAGIEPETGTIRLVGPTGTPAPSGLGRLQFYNKGFGSVCSDGWSIKSEQVACRQMGYNNVKDKGPGNESCSSIMGQNYCGPEQEKIVAVNFMCTGREASLNQCPHAVGDDIYCVHAEDVVIACEGDGDPSGVGAFHKEEALVQKKRFLSLIHLTCFDSLETAQGLGGPPGTMHLVACPPNCSSAGGELKGAYIYTGSSAVCRAAIHSGTITQEGGEFLVVVGHRQHHFLALESHGIHSEESGAYPRSFTTAKLDHSVHNLVVSTRSHAMLQSTATAAPPLTGSATLQAQPSPLQSAAAAAAAATGAAIQQGAKSSSAAAPSTTAENSVVANTTQRNAAAQGPAAAPSKPTVVLSSSGGVTLQAQRRKRRGAISVRRPNAALHRDSADGAGAADGTQPQLPFPLASQGSGSPATADDSRRLLATAAAEAPSLQASSRTPYTRMMRIRTTPASQPEDIFHWFPPEGFNGFHGKPSDFVDTSSLAAGSLASSIRDFTVVVRAIVTGGEGQWRTLLAHSDCDGFSLVVDPNDELIFEQTCHPHQIKFGFKPKLGEKFDAAAAFSTATRFIQLFVNGQPVATEKADFDMNLRGRMTIGRASAAEADYFEGDILGVKLFSQEVPATTIQNAFSAETLAAHIPQAPSESRRTEDGRLCLSPCSLQGPRWAAAAAAAAAARVTKPAVLLSCTDSLRRVEFNGRIGQTFLAVCPPDCLHAKALLEGCKFFTARSSICKASLHTGAMPKEGGEVLLTVAEGRTFYDASQGHFGIRSTQSTGPELRSFSVEAAPPFRVLSCDTNATFALKLGVGERELVVCPAGCLARSNARVYGSGFYSLLSSVCRAAIHAGALKDVGGEVEIIASRGRQRFSGSAVNGIASETSGEYIRSFVFVTPSSASSSAEGVEAISRSTAGSQRQLS